MEFVEKVESVENQEENTNQERNPLESFAKTFANVIGEFVDQDTKELINKTISANNDERGKIFSEYIQKHPEMRSVPVYFNKEDTIDIDELVREKKIINSKIANLSEKDQIEFWAKYHDIPTEVDVNNKLDTVLDSIKILNSNMIENFNEKLDDIYTELSILRKNMK